jgi:threonine dehydrogenase-like Zn-dependent dehydrogenase
LRYIVSPRLELPTDGTFLHRTIVTTFCPAGRERLAELLGILERGLDLTPLFTHALPLTEVVGAYDIFRERRDGVLKIALG